MVFLGARMVRIAPARGSEAIPGAGAATASLRSGGVGAARF